MPTKKGASWRHHKGSYTRKVVPFHAVKTTRANIGLSQRDLYPYQQEGARWLSTMPQALLADEPGLGKSAQAIAACDLLRARRILVLCPASARITWAREFQIWSQAERHIWVAFGMRDLPDFKTDRVEVLIASYDLSISLQVRKKILTQRWDVLILDEAHYLKELTAQRTKLAYGTTAGKHQPTASLAANSTYVWRLTGTPMMNHAGELWTHLFSAGVLDLPYLGYLDKYCITVDDGWKTKVVGVKNAPELRSLLDRFMLRRKKTDVLHDMTPISFHNVVVEPDEVDMRVFYTHAFLAGQTALRSINNEIGDQDKDIIDVVNRAKDDDDLMDKLRRLQPTMATLRRHTGLSKVFVTARIIDEELNSGAYKKIVLFAIHIDVIRMLQNILAKHGVVVVRGGLHAQIRQNAIDQFQTSPRTRIFIGQIQAAGVNLTLTAAHEVAFVESSWVPSENYQAAMRVHRIGQLKPVRVRFFSVANSFDERITEAIKRKTQNITKIFE